jgi:hypothetical protein
METLQGAAIEVFGTGPRSDQLRKVHIFSDLLQHSDAFSLYRDARWSPESGRRLADLSSLGTTALDGAEVYLYLVDRDQVGVMGPDYLNALVEFWDAFLAAQNATVLRVRRIEG